MTEKQTDIKEQKKTKPTRLKAKRPKGFEDKTSTRLISELNLIEKAVCVYQNYGFTALQTPTFEYADLIGKFLPDEDRPNKGIFSFQDDDQNWLALRYDLTAPLARYVAENFDSLPKPYRRYQVGTVWRNEKPGPGRFREFTQCDADNVGAANIYSDGEMVMMAADIMEAVGNQLGEYCIKINDRRLLDCVFSTLDISGPEEEQAIRRLTLLRAIDKLDRLGIEGVEHLLGEGRRDESGDFTQGAGLKAHDVDKIIAFIQSNHQDRGNCLVELEKILNPSDHVKSVLSELGEMDRLISKCGYESDRIRFDLSVVRGLDYYTSIVFEADVLIETQNEKGQPVRIGSVGGGGRYNDLITRFRKDPVPATGFSFGVSRFAAILDLLDRRIKEENSSLVILVMEPDYRGDYFLMARQAREAGLRAEVYLGEGGMRAQMKFADKKQDRFAVIIGEEERSQGLVTLKDLKQGRELAKEISDRKTWQTERPAQKTVSRTGWIEEIKKWDA